MHAKILQDSQYSPLLGSPCMHLGYHNLNSHFTKEFHMARKGVALCLQLNSGYAWILINNTITSVLHNILANSYVRMQTATLLIIKHLRISYWLTSQFYKKINQNNRINGCNYVLLQATICSQLYRLKLDSSEMDALF